MDFARHAWNDALSINFSTVGSICWYLIPCSWLGLKFMEDPRYVEMARALLSNRHEDDRIEIARQHFIKISQQTTGLNGERVHNALHKTKQVYHQIKDTRMSSDGVINISLDAWELHPDIQHIFPRELFLGYSRKELSIADIRGDMSDPLSLKVHVGMSIWLGTGFMRDPQYAWVKDVIDRARSFGRLPMHEIIDYAEKRIDRALIRYSEK